MLKFLKRILQTRQLPNHGSVQNAGCRTFSRGFSGTAPASFQRIHTLDEVQKHLESVTTVRKIFLPADVFQEIRLIQMRPGPSEGCPSLSTSIQLFSVLVSFDFIFAMNIKLTRKYI